MNRKLLEPEQLKHALNLQKNCPMPLGQILIGEGFVRHRQLGEALAIQNKMPFADLIDNPPANDLMKPEHRHMYTRHGVVPWQRDGDNTIIAVTRINDDIKNWIHRHYGSRVKLRITSPLDILKSVTRRFQNEDSEDACFALARRHPHRSALRNTGTGIKPLLALFGMLSFGIYAPAATIASISTALLLFYLATLMFKTVAFAIGTTKSPYPATRPPVPDAMLPTYTIMVPLYQEQAALTGLLNSLRSLDYPKSKLDIKLLVEADDTPTINSLKALKPESYFDIIEVPPSEPRTKPKALNYGLKFARGSLVTIYDAEDQPDPMQLRKSASYFLSPHGETVCLQARLNYYNRERNMLTRLFSIEYAAWFDHMLRGLEKMKMPIPLGGTSNHIEISALEKLCAWDPFNVTEDADLGMRIYSHGGSCGLLDSTTMEEAPSTISVWLRQRTRWIKGYMQTYVVCMRSPLKRLKRCGWRDFIGLQLFIGGPVAVFILSPFLWLAAAMWSMGTLPLPDEDWMQLMVQLGTANLIFGIVLHLLQALFVVKRNRWRGMLGSVLCFPLYWVMHTIAGYRAAWQIVARPYYWEKTPHFYT